jgi:hypothetical protein
MTTPLSPTDVAQLLQSAGRTLRAELTSLPPALAAWHPQPGEWCAKEVLGHLIEAERRGFAGRIRIVLASDSPRLETWDQEEVARQRQDCGRAVDDLLAEFAQAREASVVLAAGLREADLARAGQHPTVGRLTVRDLLHEWVHHDRTHLGQILANVQAYVWPAMGNAQRFSAA